MEIVAETKGNSELEKHNMTAHKNKKMSNTDPTKNPGVNIGVLEGYFRMLLLIQPIKIYNMYFNSTM